MHKSIDLVAFIIFPIWVETPSVIHTRLVFFKLGNALLRVQFSSVFQVEKSIESDHIFQSMWFDPHPPPTHPPSKLDIDLHTTAYALKYGT